MDDDLSDVFSDTTPLIVSSDDEPSSPQSSEKDYSYDIDPNPAPVMSSTPNQTPNQSLQLLDIDDPGIDSVPSLPPSPDIDSSDSQPPCLKLMSNPGKFTFQFK